MQAVLPSHSTGVQHLDLSAGHGGGCRHGRSWDVEMVAVVWMASRGAERAAVAKKNGELRRTIEGVCTWRLWELPVHPCHC